MSRYTLDLESEEMLLTAMLLGQFIDQQTRALRDTSMECGNTAEQIATRVAIATRLRGKLPLVFEFDRGEQER